MMRMVSQQQRKTMWQDEVSQWQRDQDKVDEVKQGTGSGDEVKRNEMNHASTKPDEVIIINCTFQPGKQT